MRPSAKIFLALCFLLQPLAALAQDSLEAALRTDVEFLSSSLCEGRAAGSRGGVEAAAYICRRMSALGYVVAVQSFAIDSARVGHNVMAWSAEGGAPPFGSSSSGLTPPPLRGGPPEARESGVPENLPIFGVSSRVARPSGGTPPPLTVVMACYDGIGIREGQIYPGADSNASGVAALLSLAERLRGKDNLLFVFTDARNVGSRGAEALRANLKGRRISLLVNLDIIGSSLAPVDEYWRDYLIALGADRWRQSLDRCNAGIGLHLYYEYYRSRNFTALFYRKMGDQAAFVADGVPAILFTSGITPNTNKTTDTPETLNYSVFARRVELISKFLNGRK